MKKIIALICFVVIVGTSYSQFRPSIGLNGGAQVRIDSDYDKLGYVFGGYIANYLPTNTGNIIFSIGYGVENNTHENNDIEVNSIASIKTSFTYSVVPVLCGYEFNRNSRLSPFVLGGVIFSRTLTSEKQTLYDNGDIEYGFDSRYSHNSPFYIQVTGGITYSLVDKINLNLSTDIRYNTAEDDPYDNAYCVPWSLIVKAGLSYYFF